MKNLIIGQLQEQMNFAVECVQGGRYAEAVLAYQECAKLTEMLELDSKTPRPVQKQLAIDIQP